MGEPKEVHRTSSSFVLRSTTQSQQNPFLSPSSCTSNFKILQSTVGNSKPISSVVRLAEIRNAFVSSISKISGFASICASIDIQTLTRQYLSMNYICRMNLFSITVETEGTRVVGNTTNEEGTTTASHLPDIEVNMSVLPLALITQSKSNPPSFSTALIQDPRSIIPKSVQTPLTPTLVQLGSWV